MMKISGSGSISQRHGSVDPDPHQNVMDPQHWKVSWPWESSAFPQRGPKGWHSPREVVSSWPPWSQPSLPMGPCWVSDPHWFNADPDPKLFLIADPDPGSGSRVWWPKIEENSQLEILILIFLKLKIAIYISLGLLKGRSSYRRSLQPLKRTSSTSKTWKFCTFY